MIEFVVVWTVFCSNLSFYKPDNCGCNEKAFATQREAIQFINKKWDNANEGGRLGVDVWSHTLYKREEIELETEVHEQEVVIPERRETKRWRTWSVK